jgi:chromosome partitioning protein
MGRRVLLVDLDPQANATTGVGVEHRGVERSIYDCLVGSSDAQSIVRKTEYANLELIPSTIDLAGAELELVSAIARETKLKRVLERLVGYDVIFVDCPPSLGLLTVNAMTAAERILIPIQCEYYALEGLSQLLRNVELVRSGLNPLLEVGGIVLTMYDARTKLSEEVASEVRKHFGDKVFTTIIPRSVRLSEAPSYGQPAITYEPTARGSRAYMWLAEEFDRRFFLGDAERGEVTPESVQVAVDASQVAESEPVGQDAPFGAPSTDGHGEGAA